VPLNIFPVKYLSD